MKILFYTQYYPPETGAPPNRISDWAIRLKRNGHDVSVLTALPNYPTGKVFAEYKDKVLFEEELDGIRVIRTWIYATRSAAFFKRIANYISFAISSLLLGAFKVGSPDVIVVESPPLFLGASGLLLSWILNSRMVFNVSDLWPKSAVDLGVLKSNALIRLSTWLENLIYRNSILITGQSEGIVANITSRFPKKPVELITNGADPEFFAGSSPAESFLARSQFQLEKKFVVGYAGLHGLAQRLETVLRAASALRDKPEIMFAFFGDGPEKATLLAEAEQMALQNVRFYPNQSRSAMPKVLSTFDVSVIPLRRLDLFRGALPSKLFEAMTAAVPIILSVEGEAKDLIERAEAGLYVAPEHPAALAAAILKIYENRDYGRQLGQNGRTFVVRYFNRAQIARRFEQLLHSTQTPLTVPATES
jgi:glycosyltransferase involved in cell wall biosynthesis